MTGIEELRQTVRAYCERYHIDPFTISEPYELAKDWRSQSFPYAERSGCYAFFNAEMELLYVGKASCGSTIGRRADTYFKWNREHERLDQTGSSGWKGKPIYLHTIPVHEAHQAPSLEEYLIETLHSPENRAGRKYEKR